MKYIGMPAGMWLLFKKSFEEKLTSVLGYDKSTAKAIAEKAKPKYKEIITKLPAFEKEDRFKMNIVNCAMLAAFILNMDEKPGVEDLTEYYAKAMMTKPMIWFCKMGGKAKFSKKDIHDMKKTAFLKAADRNEYSWNMDFYAYEDGSGYEARFTKCGICTLMKELGIWSGEVVTPKEPIISEDGEVSFINAGKSGVFVPCVEHWKNVRKGGHIGDILNPLTGEINERISSPTDGIVFTLREYPIVNEGSLIARILA